MREVAIGNLDSLSDAGVALFSELRRRGFQLSGIVGSDGTAQLIVSPAANIDSTLRRRLARHGGQILKLVEMNANKPGTE